MKFQCDRCKTRYSIGEEKVRGKVLKIRCKNCSAVITVREGNASTSGPEGGKDSGSQAALGGAKDKGSTVGKAPTAANPNVPANGAAGGRGKAPVLEAAFDRAMARPSGAMAAMPAPAADRGATTRDKTRKEDDDGDGATQMTPAPDLGADIEWFVSIDGEQEGPFTLPEARKRVSKKKPDEEMFAWQEGFEDWLPIDKVPELAPHLPTARPPARAPAIPAAASKGSVSPMAAKGAAAAAAPAPSSDESPFSLAALASSSPSAAAEASGDDLQGDGDAEKDNYDFDIGEASRVVKLPMLVPPPKGDAATPAPVRRTGVVQALPGLASARGTGGQPVVGGQVVGSDVNIAAAVLQPRPRAKHGVFFFVGIGALLAVAGAMVWVLMAETKTEFGPIDDTGYTSEYIAQLYQQNPELEKKVAEIVPQILQPTPKGGKGGARKTPRPGDQPGAVASSRPRDYEEFGGPGSSGGPRQPDDILEKSRSEGGALKMCWERALKTNPELKQRGVRLEVNVNIKASGALANVNVASAAADNQLKACVRDRVAAWKLPPASNDLPMQFPIVFQ
jgi:predicted Zn finger-like uncharacterized protein